MCLTIKTGMKLQIAKEDIEVYKVIYRDNTSLHQGFAYAPKSHYYLCSSLKPVLSRSHNIRRRTVECGFHSYIKRISNPYNNMAKIVKFIIPKGAEYYLGDNNDAVSNAIISGDLKPLKVIK